MEVKRIHRYKTPEYPLYNQYYKYQVHPFLLKRSGILAASVLSMLPLVSCIPFGAGGMVNPPAMTEEDARDIVERVFLDNGIRLQRDFPLQFTLGDTDTVRFEADGYNDSLRVGYEYDDNYITSSIYHATVEAMNDSGPYVKLVEEVEEDMAHYLSETMQAFIDTLRSQGII